MTTLIKAINKVQPDKDNKGFLKITTDDIPATLKNAYITIEVINQLGRLEAETKGSREEIFSLERNLTSQIEFNTEHRIDVNVHLTKEEKKRLLSLRSQRGRRGLPGPPGSPGMPGSSGAPINIGTVEGQMLYWDATNTIWQRTVVTDLGWDNTEKLLIVGSTDPSTKDPGVSFRTTKVTANRIDLVMDESSSHDKLSVVGKTALKNTFFQIMALDGEDAYLNFFSGTNYATIWKNSNDDFKIGNYTTDKDIAFEVVDGGVVTEIMRFVGATSRVGIGRIAPKVKLDINGTVMTTRVLAGGVASS